MRNMGQSDMTLRELTKTVKNDDTLCIKDYAGNIIIKDTKFDIIPSEYLDLPIIKYHEYGTRFCGKELPKGYEVFISTIDMKAVTEIKDISDAFASFLNSFENYNPEDVAIICRTILEEHTRGFKGKHLVERCFLGFTCDLPERDSVKFREVD